MFGNPVQYDEPLYRPPSEAYSAIVQATLGCAWNRCAFCDMYEGKRFRVRSFEDVSRDLEALGGVMPDAGKVFLADGNAFALSYDRLMPILEVARGVFPHLRRVSSSALPGDILCKSDAELVGLRGAGLELLYVGVESGDGEVLRAVNKSETPESVRAGVMKAHAAGISTSVMIITGLGGRRYSEQHALHSADLVSELGPRYLSTLTLFLPRGLADYQRRFGGDYELQDGVELLEELRMFVGNLRMEGSIFRSNHVSNALRLEGVVSRDVPKLLGVIDGMLARERALPSARFSPRHGY